jgi:hypothetical protein
VAHDLGGHHAERRGGVDGGDHAESKVCRHGDIVGLTATS